MSLSTDDLRQVRTIVTHDNCPDGLGSALLLKLALPDAQVRFVQHGAPELVGLVAEPGMLFCDIAPPADRVEEFVAAGTLVLDHHGTARSVVERFGARGVFADERAEPGVSGATLAYREVTSKLCPEHPDREFLADFATIAGVRDTWQRSSPRWEDSCAQSESLMFWPRAHWLEADVAGWKRLLAIGPTLLAKQAERVKRAIERGWRFTVGAVRIITVGGGDITSDAAEALDHEVDLVAGFNYRANSDGKLVLVYSLRSHTDFDCAGFAKAQGGGGHTRAAGFSVAVAPFEDGTPYRVLRDRLEAWKG